MRKTSVRELHIHTSEPVREAAEGSIIVIERRGTPVAELRPLTTPSRIAEGKKERMFTSMQRIWARMPEVRDSAEILEQYCSR
jgi:antitoxin (DNA-binding transcriptional repressor) of toxin-antitoxin stability system